MLITICIKLKKSRINNTASQHSEKYTITKNGLHRKKKYLKYFKNIFNFFNDILIRDKNSTELLYYDEKNINYKNNFV